MITLAEVEKGDDWDGKSWNDDAFQWQPNLESKMDFAEHQRIVCEARMHLNGAVPNDNPEAKKIFEALQKAYIEPGSDTVVVIQKGIHQTHSDAHIKIHVVKASERNVKDAGHHFHLNVEPTEGPLDEMSSDWRFKWVSTQFKCWVGKTAYFWPSPERRARRGYRRDSISAKDLEAHVQKVREEREAERQRKLAEERNAQFMSAWSKFQNLHPDLIVPVGKFGVKQLRLEGHMTCKLLVNKKPSAKQAEITYKDGVFARKNL